MLRPGPHLCNPEGQAHQACVSVFVCGVGGWGWECVSTGPSPRWRQGLREALRENTSQSRFHPRWESVQKSLLCWLLPFYIPLRALLFLASF